MSTKNNSTINLKSSEKVANFLKTANLHKKDFAQMIGVTLSYVYNLIDNTIPFSTRSTTLERISTVMDINPEEFCEYKISQEPIIIDEAILFIKNKIKSKNLTTVQFLKSFPRKRRLMMVDILRGARPLPLDWKELCLIAQILDVSEMEMYVFWEKRFKELIKHAGFNIENNLKLADTIFNCTRKYIASPVKD